MVQSLILSANVDRIRNSDRNSFRGRAERLVMAVPHLQAVGHPLALASGCVPTHRWCTASD